MDAWSIYFLIWMSLLGLGVYLFIISISRDPGKDIPEKADILDELPKEIKYWLIRGFY